VNRRADRTPDRRNSKSSNTLEEKPTDSSRMSIIFRIAKAYNIRIQTEDSSIKVEMIAKNSAKKPINFSATKYFTQKHKKIMSYMDYFKMKAKEKEMEEKASQQTQKRKRSRKRAHKVKRESILRII
jgi:hypothetical protein